VALAFAVVVYWLLQRDRGRLLWLSCASLAALAWFHPVFAAAVALVTVVLHGTSRMAMDGRLSRSLWALSIVVLALIFALAGKYAATVASSFQDSLPFSTEWLLMPLGLSYLFFRVVHFALDTYRGTV